MKRFLLRYSTVSTSTSKRMWTTLGDDTRSFRVLRDLPLANTGPSPSINGEQRHAGNPLHPTRRTFIKRVERLVILALTTLASLVLWLPNLCAQARLLHSPDSDAPSFEVSTIRPSEDTGPMRIDLSASNFNVVNASLEDLINFAYDVRSEAQVEGLPKWGRSQQFDVHAKASGQEITFVRTLSTMQQIKRLREMLQALVSDRFGLKLSFKSKAIPAYALVVAKGGPKLKSSDATPPSPESAKKPGAHVPSFGMTRHDQFTATEWDMPSLAEVLTRFQELGHRVVVDETGLKGRYNFVLNGVSTMPPSDDSTTSIFTALQDQLGLKLEPRNEEVEVLAIESVSVPSPN